MFSFFSAICFFQLLFVGFFWFFDLFFDLFFFYFIKIINLEKKASFQKQRFHFLLFHSFSGFFPREISNFFLSLYILKIMWKLLFKSKPCLLVGHIYFREDIGINILKYVLITRQFIAKIFIIFFVFVQKISDYFKHF